MNLLPNHSEMLAAECSSKPLELYVFIDPSDAGCYGLIPVLRRLQVEYEQYFTYRIIMKTSLSPQKNLGQGPHDTRVPHPALPAVAVKAAEFQGKRAGFKYLSRLLDYRFLKGRDITTQEVLLEIAELTGIDAAEFIQDFRSVNAAKSFQCDLYISREMEVHQAPSFVFFNNNFEDEGLMVEGIHDYEMYVKVLEELLGRQMEKAVPPSLDELFRRFDSLTTGEIAAIYKVNVRTAERELKKRLLQRRIECLPVRGATLWRRKMDL
ncbi:Predicted dithiol-disulfide isomerase, DsbA family [Bhargavaea ginsengi]|uniref:Predicted dithiol-disulfide isomerase, DsbA family n=1 Tax=Bhargavaea ginsengi TaxID=426757 RepID=A0A1H7A5I4_9BACL|nr:DsbA family protein [Bhargavaea ginsengi]SEJ60933.1 Predicted dithiol-disulfide isomerase, DsbA family [Bhargavaea ginsengi]